MSSIWLGRVYYVFGFFFIIVILLVVVCAEMSQVLTYMNLCVEDWRWWWKSFFASSFVAFYIFCYSINYLVCYTLLRLLTLHGLGDNDGNRRCWVPNFFRVCASPLLFSKDRLKIIKFHSLFTLS